MLIHCLLRETWTGQVTYCHIEIWPALGSSPHKPMWCCGGVVIVFQHKQFLLSSPRFLTLLHQQGSFFSAMFSATVSPYPVFSCISCCFVKLFSRLGHCCIRQAFSALSKRKNSFGWFSQKKGNKILVFVCVIHYRVKKCWRKST